MRTHRNQHEHEPVFLERYYDAKRRGRCARVIGQLAIHESLSLDKRFDDEMASGFSEALAGRVDTEYTFNLHDGKLVADDGEPLEIMMLRARRDAYEMSAQDPRMNFVVDRFGVEIDELHDQERMAGDQCGYNTLITFSPFTEELIATPELLKRGYQKPEYRRSMLRISHWDGFRMHILTRSLDNSSVFLLKDTADDSLGYSFSSQGSLGMLGERIKGTYSLDDARKIADKVCKSYDARLESMQEGIYMQGRNANESSDLLEFVISHDEVMKNLKQESITHARKAKSYEEFRLLLDSSMHRHLALLQQILEGRTIAQGSISDAADQAGDVASAAGVSYDMCGYEVSNPSVLNPTNGGQTGFESLMAYAGVRVQCPNNKCKEFVIVDTSHLRNGILHCSACLHTLDVCGDTRKADRIRKEAIKKRQESQAQHQRKQEMLREKRLKKLGRRHQLIS